MLCEICHQALNRSCSVLSYHKVKEFVNSICIFKMVLMILPTESGGIYHIFISQIGQAMLILKKGSWRSFMRIEKEDYQIHRASDTIEMKFYECTNKGQFIA